LKKTKTTLIDCYLAHPITIDLVLIILLWVTNRFLTILQLDLDRKNQIDVLSNIVNSDVALAGFILAALTIIVTFKSNLKAKGIEDAENALELIFSSKHYDSIVDVFKKALIEFIGCFIVLFGSWLYSDCLHTNTINRINISGLFITAAAIVRSIYVLIMILNLSKQRGE